MHPIRLAAISGALLGTAITAGTLGQSPAAASSPQAPAATGVIIKSYAPVVRQVVPSVVLIRTRDTLGPASSSTARAISLLTPTSPGTPPASRSSSPAIRPPASRAWSAATAPMIWP